MQEEARKLIHGQNFGFLATLNPDGSPQVTPVWVDEKDGYVLVNTAVGRRKERNTKRDPRVALAVPDWNDPYTYVEIRGRVVDRITGPDAEEHIDNLAVKYTGEKFKWRTPGSRRVILKIKPDNGNGEKALKKPRKLLLEDELAKILEESKETYSSTC